MSIAQLRQRGATNFEAYYQSLCALESTSPIAGILTGAKLNTLKCNASQLRPSDWHPLLTALQINKTFHTISIYKKWEDTYLGKGVPPATGVRSVLHRKADSIRGPDRDTISAIVRSVKECLCVSSTLKSLTIEGIYFNTKDIAQLCKGLSEVKVLAHFSLKGSRIGDKGVEAICSVFKNSWSLEWLDLTACDVGHKGTTCLAGVIRFQCTARQTAAWQGSLRHHLPNLADILGLRRLTLNFNRNIGDKGASELSSALMDDKWIRALDMQSCGISTDGAVALSESLHLNNFIVVLDLRGNELIDDDILEDISDHLASNAHHLNIQQYSPLDLEIEHIVSPSKPSAALCTISRKAKHIKPYVKQGPQGRAPKPDARKISLKKCGPTKLYSCQRTLSSSSIYKKRLTPHKPKGQSSSEEKVISDEMVSKIKHLKVELLTCKRKLHEESVARSIAESRLLQLEVENKRLTEQLKKMCEGCHNSLDNAGIVMVNKDTIDVVETAFQHFHRFLDTLSLNKNTSSS